jgi:hypothetical protein
MSRLAPSDRSVLAATVSDSVVVASDPDARNSGLYYWELARPFTSAVVDAVKRCEDEALRALGARLLEVPGDPERYYRFRSALAEAPASRAVDQLLAFGWRAECNSRIGYHVGRSHAPDAALIAADDLRRVQPGPRMRPGAQPEVLVVVPFRDRTGGLRLRNLLACLMAVADQSFPRDDYQVTVVESDAAPRWRDAIAPYADHHLFAEKPTTFNKSWAVNVGVVNTPGPTQVICILDADVLVDRDFIARNVARFARPGTGGHLTYRNMTCLTAAATSWAIDERVRRRAADLDPAYLRGFQLRRPPGCCLWVRTEAFHRIGGMDERYEGWGGEDNDFAYRFDVAAPLDHYDDWLLHMHHPPASLLRDDGELVNAHIPALSWRPDGPIGKIDRFAATTRDDRGA